MQYGTTQPTVKLSILPPKLAS